MGGGGVGGGVRMQPRKLVLLVKRPNQTDFRNFVCSLFPMAILFYFYFTVGGRKKLPLHHHSAG